jgi:DNA-binding response OmpR family regulator
MRLLLVEDDLKLSASITKNLKADHFIVDQAFDGVQAEELALVNRYDVIILDIRLPRQDGWQTCINLRRKGLSIPILILTAMDDVFDKVKGLDSGADDYLTKPFHTAELTARIRALSRRPSSQINSVIEKFGVTFNPASHSVFRDGKEIILSSKEFSLLELFMRNAGKIVTRDTIFESLWDMNFDPRSNVIDAMVKLLRAKIDKGYPVPLIHTVRGVGYQFSSRND